MNIILCSGDQIQGQEIIIVQGKSIDMERKTVTITIENVPELMLQEFWSLAIEEAKKDPGMPIERSDNIVIDFNAMQDSPEEIGGLFSSAATCHLIQTADKIFNS